MKSIYRYIYMFEYYRVYYLYKICSSAIIIRRIWNCLFLTTVSSSIKKQKCFEMKEKKIKQLKTWVKLSQNARKKCKRLHKYFLYIITYDISVHVYKWKLLSETDCQNMQMNEVVSQRKMLAMTFSAQQTCTGKKKPLKNLDY